MGTMIFHLMVLRIFLRAADYRNGDTEAAYMHTCPGDSFTCSTASKVTTLGFFIFTCILLFFLSTDFSDGILMIYESIRENNRNGVFAGTMILFITTCSFTVSFIFNKTVGMSNVEIMADAAILLFLNDVDEKLFETFTKIFPAWMKEINELIEQMYSYNNFNLPPRNRVDTNQSNYSEEQDTNEGIFLTTREISENELLRRQVEQLQKQVNILSSAVLKIQPDLISNLEVLDKNKCPEKGVEPRKLILQAHFDQKSKLQDQGRLQKKNNQKRK